MTNAKKHKITLHPHVENNLDNLDNQVFRCVEKAFERLAYHPELAKKLSKPLQKLYSYRFGTPEGEYRIVFDRAGGELTILAIGPRKDVYKGLLRKLG